MAYLEDLNNIATILLQDYANKNLVPEWFSVNMKTLLSKNITLEDWNNVQWYLKNVAAENEAVFKFCQNLNSALTNFEANVDSAISQAATNALNTATSYTNTKIAAQEAVIATGYTALSDRIDNVDTKYLSLSQNIVKDFNTQIQEVANSVTGVHVRLDNEYPRLEDHKIPAKYLPSYVDDVLEVPGIHNQTTGEFNKIYVDVNDNKIYRWSGSKFIEISPSSGTGGSADLSNYYTKAQTEAAIQSALNAIGVAEGGAY